jgi:hypothetical protein
VIVPAFVFQFGYESPQQRTANDRSGWDDESSQWVVIDAPDAAAALAWGREVAERFVGQVGGPSWRAGGYAHWVEPLSACPWAVGRPSVALGQLPEFAGWVQAAADGNGTE